MRFLSQKVVKGQAVADFLAKPADLRITKLYEDLPDEKAEVCITQTSFEEQVWNYSSTARQERVLKEAS